MAVEYTAEEVIQALRAANGIIAAAARKLGCSRTTVYNKIERYKTVREAYEEENEKTIDIAEGRLMSLVNSPDHKDHFKAVRFLLRTKGKDRGYSERHEVDHSGEVEVIGIDVVPPDAED